MRCVPRALPLTCGMVPSDGLSESMESSRSSESSGRKGDSEELGGEYGILAVH
jgi:hypothetical protein